ncbi:MAG: PadR family transcriptional regulator [Sporichthyaceae bacterium]
MPGQETSTPTLSHVLLGLLSIRSWTGYELTNQIRHSLGHIWPSSDANVYREQQRLVRLGWAEATDEAAGPARTRKRYTISAEGRAVLDDWLASAPSPAVLQLESMLRVWFADAGSTEQLGNALRAAAADARTSLDHVVAVFARYLDGEGAFEERAHLNAMVGELVADLFGLLEQRCAGLAKEVEAWPTTKGIGLDPTARARMQRVVATYGRTPPKPGGVHEHSR